MKTTNRQRMLQALLAVGVMGSYSANAWAALIFTNQNNPTSTSAFNGSVSNGDLLQTNLSSASYSGWFSGFDGPNLRDGSASTTFGASPGSAYGQFSGSPKATFNLDISSNTLGYDITTINSFAGFEDGFAMNYANQLYDIEYELVSNPGNWTLLATSPVVNYQPFPITSATPSASSTFVSISDSGGVILSGVKGIRISILNNGGHDGIVMKEFDVIGSPTVVPEPSSFAMLLFGGMGLGWLRRRR